MKKIFSILLLVVFITETTPHDLLHLLAHHEDNHDYDYSETLVSPHHIHCAVLQLTLPAFDKNEAVVYFASQPFFSFLTPSLYQGSSSKYEVAPSLRGPPVC